MKNITIKVHNSNQVVQQVQVITKDGEPTVILAQNGVNYELIDNETGHALQHMVTKRIDKDLHLSFEGNGQEADVIIENFYDYKDSALIGLAEEGHYYHYVPDTANADDYVTKLNNGDIEGQALGGQHFAEPWWVGNTSDSSIFPLLAGAGFLGGIFTIEKDIDGKISKSLQDFLDNSTTVSSANPANVENAFNLSFHSPITYTLPEHIAKALDEETVAGMNDVENLATNTAPDYHLADAQAVPTLDLDMATDVVAMLAPATHNSSNENNESTVANYDLYNHIAMPIIIESDTPII